MTLYLDTSAIVPLFVEQSGTSAIATLLQQQRSPPLVSEFAMGELASGFGRMARAGELDLASAEAALKFADSWRVTESAAAPLDPVDIRLAVTFVRRFELKLRMPDAIHAATARRLGATLVTFDLRLAAAAAALGIACTVPA